MRLGVVGRRTAPSPAKNEISPQRHVLQFLGLLPREQSSHHDRWRTRVGVTTITVTDDLHELLALPLHLLGACEEHAQLADGLALGAKAMR